jgi:hypothetical protein
MFTMLISVPEQTGKTISVSILQKRMFVIRMEIDDGAEA